MQSKIIALLGIVLFTWNAADDFHSGFRLYLGQKSKKYTQTVTIPDRNSRELDVDLDLSKRWYATITAFNSIGESTKAKEINFKFTAPKSPSNLKIK